MSTQNTFVQTLGRVAIVLLLAVGYEGFRQLIFPGFSSWQSNLAAISFTASVLFLLSFWLLRGTATQAEGLPNTVIENLPEIACIIGDGGRFLQWNSNLETALGYTAAEVEKLTAADTVTEEQRETVRQTLTRTFADGTAKTESVLLAKDGTRIPCLLTGVRLVINGAPCVLGIAVDLRKLRQAEESLRRLASIVEFSEDAIVGKNTDGVITSWNRAAEKMYGYTTVEVVGRDVSMLVPAEKQA